MTGYVLFASMIIMLLVGVPISVTLGAATLAALLTLDVPLAVIPQRLFTALDASSIMARSSSLRATSCARAEYPADLLISATAL